MKDSRQKKMFLDIDDCGLCFLGPWQEWLASKYGFPINKSYIPRTYGYEEFPELNKNINKYITEFIEGGGCSDLPPFEGFKAFTEEIQRRGWDIIFVTAHLASRLEERIKNLNRYDIKFNHIYCTSFYNSEGKKEYLSKIELIKLLKYDDSSKYRCVFVDDRAKTAIEFAKANLGVAFTMKRAYNLNDLENCDDEARSRLVVSTGGTSKATQVANMYKTILDFV
jgi:FMN phosphatase YigB (HAD superfamily)